MYWGEGSPYYCDGPECSTMSVGAGQVAKTGSPAQLEEGARDREAKGLENQDPALGKRPQG